MEFTRDDCISALANIRALLDAIHADMKWESGPRSPRRWKIATGEEIDISRTLDNCFTDNRLTHVLQWSEFNIADGVARRERLLKVLNALRRTIARIEHGDPQDPFLWARKSIDAAATAAMRDVSSVSRYIGDFIRSIEPNLTPVEARNRFCFNEWQRGQSYKEINVALSHHPEWENFDSDLSVRSAISSWAKRIGQAPRKGQPGKRYTI